MHFPLKVPAGANVRYVDYLSREESLRRYPELDRDEIVDPQYVEDGFVLAGIASETQAFVIANHVLEHSPDPIGTLENWWRVVKPHGILFVTVPLAEHCFDRSRPITSLHHFVDDHAVAADAEALAQRDVQHYVEWVTISTPNSEADAGRPVSRHSPEEAERHARELCAMRVEIHFHAFSVDSYRALLEHFAARSETPCELLEVEQLGAEVLGVLRKK